MAFLCGSILLTSTAPAGASGTNLSGNAYFPLIVGAKWDYKYSSGSTAMYFTHQVVSGHATAGGEAVVVRYGYKQGGVFNANYLVAPNGAIKVQGGNFAGNSKGSISSSGSYFLPSAAQVSSCHPCHFSTVITASVGSYHVTEHLAETATSAGQQTVSVPAGSFTTEKLLLALKITGSAYGMSISDTMSFPVYLAKNVGLVETGSGSLSMDIMGHSTTASTGSEVLLKYKP